MDTVQISFFSIFHAETGKFAVLCARTVVSKGVAFYIQHMLSWIPPLRRKTRPLIAVVRLSGAIGASGRSGLSDAGIAPLLERAFSKGKPAAVALIINSPGGSPVQSSLIGARIRRLAEEHEIPVYAFVEDVAASGGYWLAAAADVIYVDDSSIVGSIGVISAGFGAHIFLSRQGIERRVHTAGTSKSMMDPFRPEKPEDVTRLKGLLDQIHQSFISHVKLRRGPKLTDDPALFSGEVWVGQNACDVGLADFVGHMEPVLREKFGSKVRFKQYGQRRSLAQRFGLNVTDALVHQIEERAAFARFGL